MTEAKVDYSELANPSEFTKFLVNHLVESKPVPLVTLEAKLKEQLPVSLTPVLNSEVFAALFDDLGFLPDKIQEAGKAADEALKALQQARSELEVAEATVIAFPDRELKNESARKAYVVEKTTAEAERVRVKQDLKLDADRALSDLTIQLRATEKKVELVTSLLGYLTR